MKTLWKPRALRNIYTASWLTALIMGLTGLPSAAAAQIYVIGNGPEKECYNHALYGDQGSRPAIDVCDKALDTALTIPNRASTFNNRGVLLMRKGRLKTAQLDFNQALNIAPNLTEVHINYAALLIKMKDYDAALTSLDIAIADKTSEKLPSALYNRAIIYDHRMDYRQAYNDLKAALALKPDWTPAIEAISRYEVTSKRSN